MSKPTVAELVRSVVALEASVDQMLGALKADLAALRADLVEMEKVAASAPVPPPPSRRSEHPRASPGSGSRASAHPTRKASGSMHPAVTEETLAPKKRDPRADD
jgi:hypothetical protein